ncbi:MAG TPA: hypothetical protein VHN77_10635 [Phycisphaerales bacterium]|nr:hypothetical protein [Phycisphaerales bacterium]
MRLRAALPDDPTTAIVENAESPADLCILAIARFRASQEADAEPMFARRAREALNNARAIMADPANAQTWAKDEDAKVLVAEATALIDCEGGK